MDDIVACEHCRGLVEERVPHKNLQLISQIPQSSIYRCKACQVFWMCSVDEGWENLSFDNLWQLAN